MLLLLLLLLCHAVNRSLPAGLGDCTMRCSAAQQ
jgi:hypothetical protein